MDNQTQADVRQLAKWPNEEQTAPIDKQALARVLATMQAQPEQEPDDLTIAYMAGLSRGKDLAPQRKPWVSLTREDKRRYCPDWLPQSDFDALLINIDAKLRELNEAPQLKLTDDTKRLDALAENSWDLRCFDMPTGQGDADIGWRVIEHHMGKPNERTVAEVFRDDPRQAIDEAIEAAHGKVDA